MGLANATAAQDATSSSTELLAFLPAILASIPSFPCAHRVACGDRRDSVLADHLSVPSTLLASGSKPSGGYFEVAPCPCSRSVTIDNKRVRFKRMSPFGNISLRSPGIYERVSPAQGVPTFLCHYSNPSVLMFLKAIHLARIRHQTATRQCFRMLGLL